MHESHKRYRGRLNGSNIFACILLFPCYVNIKHWSMKHIWQSINNENDCGNVLMILLLFVHILIFGFSCKMHFHIFFFDAILHKNSHIHSCIWHHVMQLFWKRKALSGFKSFLLLKNFLINWNESSQKYLAFQFFTIQQLLRAIDYFYSNHLYLIYFMFIVLLNFLYISL